MKTATMKLSFIWACLAMVLFSCKSNKCQDPGPEETVYPDYTGFAVGNYWIYNIYHIDESGKETFSGETDSAVITGDTIIRGNKFFIKKTFYNNILQRMDIRRDSLQYIVNENGEVFFSSEQNAGNIRSYFTIYGKDTIRVDMKMDPKDTVINVPAGSFKTKTLKSYVYYYPLNDTQNNRAGYYRYGIGIGLIHYNVFFSGAKTACTDYRLSRYFVK